MMVLLVALGWAVTGPAHAQQPPGYPGGDAGGPGYPVPGGGAPPGPPGYTGSGGPGVFAAEPPPPRPPEFCPPVEKPPYQDTAFTEMPCPINAFNTDNHNGCGPPHYVFAGAGAMALRRQRLPQGPIALLEPVAMHDTNTITAPTSPEALDFRDVPTAYDWGVSATFGYRWGPEAVEISGFFLPRQQTSASASFVGKEDVLFGAFPTPPPFQVPTDVPTNPFLQNDIVQARLSTELGSVEANFRHQLNDRLEAFVGMRYFSLLERFDIFTDDLAVPDGGGFGVIRRGLGVPGVQADYLISARSDLVGPQLGFLYEQQLLPGFAISFLSKNMIGADFFSVQHTLTRVDTGQLGPGASRSGTQASGIIEIGAFASWWVNQHIRLRAGYQALWVINVPDASRNVSFNLNEPLGTPSDHSSIFFHGPTLDVELAF
jgi:hypothetical protein